VNYRIIHAHGAIEDGYATYTQAIAAVRAFYRNPAIGHDGDIAQGGDRTLVWACEADSEDDDGSRACCVISISHEVRS